MVPGSIPRIILSSTINLTSLLKTIKFHKNLFFFIKLILFCGVLIVLYKQIVNFDKKNWEEFRLNNWGTFFVAIVLVFPNIWISYLKWVLTIKVIGVRSSKELQIQSFFAGIVTGMLTPNMLGNFIGRFYYFDNSKRKDITLFTMLSNFAQFIASITFGWISVVLLDGVLMIKESRQLILLIGVGVVISYLCYFYGENFLLRIRKVRFSHHLKNILTLNRTYRPKLLVLSVLRFLIFTTQFSLMLNAFGETIDLEMILAIWQVYLITMLIPSLFLGKIGIKESISLFILGGLGMNAVSILFASLCIWCLNSLLPALVGLIVCKRKTGDE